jgi:hypothetical protein
MSTGKNSNELISVPLMDDEREMYILFVMAGEAKDEAKRLHAKAARAQANAEGLLDRGLRLAESIRRRRDERPSKSRREESPSEKLDRLRKLLVKALGMLGSEQGGERASAALKAEKLRRRLGRTWEQLIVTEFDDDDDLDDDDDDKDLDDDDEESVA